MKSRLIVILFTIFITISLSGNTYYVSTTGSDAASGTISAPWATWHYAFGKLNPGDILYIRGGIYKTAGILSGGCYVGARLPYKKGTAASNILISAYDKEVPILDCSNIQHSGWKVGILVDACSYIRIKGLTVENVTEHGETNYPADGWVGSGSNHIYMEQCTVTRCGGGFSFGGPNDYIYFTNCDSYNNSDLLFGAVSSGGIGGYCNGFTNNISHGMHAFLEGCRAWNNSDDGFDNMGGAGYITYNNCWAFENGHTLGDWTTNVGDGDGFKLGLTPEPKETGVQRMCTNCIAWNNDLFGFDESQDYGPVCDMTLYNCTAYQNKRSGFGFYSTSGGYTGIATIKNCIAYKNDVAGGYRQNIYLRSGCQLSNNSWQKGTISDADFVSLISTEGKGSRKSDGSLPDMNFLHLAPGSFLIDGGVNLGLPYNGNAPDIGGFETETGATNSAALTITMNNDPIGYSGFIYELDPVISPLVNGQVLKYRWVLSDNIPVSSTHDSKLQFLAPEVQTLKAMEFQLNVSNGTDSVLKNIPISIMPYKPELQLAAFKKIQGSSYEPPYSPKNAIDGNLSSIWAADGDNQWLAFSLSRPFKVSHIELAFLSGQLYSSYFDIYASSDSISWDPVLIRQTSCNFSGNIQVFNFPDSEKKYSYIKYIGHGSASNSWNNLSEIRVYGISGVDQNPTVKIKPVIYPNPVKDNLNISLNETTFKPNRIKIIDYSGKVVMEGPIRTDIKEIQIPVSIKTGIYIVALGENNLYSFFQQLIVYN